MKRLTLALFGVLILALQGAGEAKNYVIVGDSGPSATLVISDDAIRLCLEGVKKPSCSDVSRADLLDALLYPVSIPSDDATAQATTISIRVTVDAVNTDLSFTARQVALLNRRLADFNAQRTANGQATVTMGVFLRGFIVQALKNEQDQAEAHEQAEACAAFHALATNAQNQIKAALGDKSPCR